MMAETSEARGPLFTNRSLTALIGPLIAEQILAVTIGMVDTMMVSSLGEAAVSSVSLVDSVNFEDDESLNWFHRTLRKQGVIDALREAGAGEGSTVQIGDMEFDFIE